jgi:hypothetical protein
MVSERSVTCSPTPRPFLFSNNVPRFSEQPKVPGRDGEASLRMYDEGCPKESQSVDDATGYSKEEEETLEEESLSEGEEFVSVVRAVSYGALCLSGLSVDPAAGFFP